MDQHQTHAISQICRRTASFSPFRERGRTITPNGAEGQIHAGVASATSDRSSGRVAPVRLFDLKT